MNKHIPLSIPSLTSLERNNLLDAFDSSWISSTGAYVDRFEKEFADLVDCQYVVSVCNGTVALHLALLTLEVKAGDEIIIPSLTYVATGNAVRYVGATPVFVDIDPSTWCMDPEAVRAAVSEKTRGIIVVHLYGHPVDMDPINKLAKEKGLWVVEDAAEAPGAHYKGRPVGSLSDISTFSFYGNKVFSSGEGGAIALSDEKLAKFARLLRGQGMDPARRFYFPITGHNFRLTNLCCALLCAQLARRQEIFDRRFAIYELYRQELTGVPGIRMQPCAQWATISPWLFSVTVEEPEFGIGRDLLIAALAKAGIESRPFFIPLHTMPPFLDNSVIPESGLTLTEEIAAKGINLPTFPDLSDEKVREVCRVIQSACQA